MSGSAVHSIPPGEGAMASDFVGPLHQQRGGAGHQAHREMGNGHLVLNGPQLVMGCLFYFAVAEAGEVLLDDNSQAEVLFEPIGVTRDLRTSIVGDVEIFGASVGLSL